MVASDQFFSIADMLEDLAFEFDEAEIFDTAASAKIRRLLGDFDIYPSSISVVEDKFGRVRVELLTDGYDASRDSKRLTAEIGKICNRYFDVPRITNFKNETMLSFTERPNFHLSVGFAQHSAEGTFCGDTVKIINDGKGHSILIISDGMGKGSRAALDGAMGAGLVSRLISAGFGFDSALKVVNCALLVKSNDESLATLDIANVDMYTGKCELYKAGAPASYIIKNKSVSKCELTSMPAGILRGVEFAKRTAVLGSDDCVVLLSDGIADLGKDWIEKNLLSLEGLGVQETADAVLTRALKECEGRMLDDMSIIFARLERNRVTI
jgi:stage II sporulation protein E